MTLLEVLRTSCPGCRAIKELERLYRIERKYVAERGRAFEEPDGEALKGPEREQGIL